MEKREKVMLGLMAVTLVVAAVMYFPGGAPSLPGALMPSGPAPDEVTRNVEQSKLTPEQSYRLSRALDPGVPNVFYAEGALLTQDDAGLPDGAGRAAEIVYSGYIKVGQKLYAVINGVEYTFGDELAEGGYVVKSIDKNNVLLERTDGSTGRKFIKRVPLVEDDTDKIRIRVVKKR